MITAMFALAIVSTTAITITYVFCSNWIYNHVHLRAYSHARPRAHPYLHPRPQFISISTFTIRVYTASNNYADVHDKI